MILKPMTDGEIVARSKQPTINAAPGNPIEGKEPHGVVFGKPKAEQVWLKPGDRVACSVEKLGELAFSLT